MTVQDPNQQEAPTSEVGYKGDPDRGDNFNPTDDYKQAEIAEKYDEERFSDLPGRVFDKAEKAAIRSILKALPANSLILDVPSGTGRLAETILELGHRVVGVDISPAMLGVASRKLHRFGDKFTPIAGDAHKLEFEDNYFDAVICARVLMHLPLDNQIAFLKSVARVSKGPVLFNQSLLTRYHVIRRKIRKLVETRTPAAFHVTPDDLTALLKGAGLEELSRRRVFPVLSEAVFFSCRKV